MRGGDGVKICREFYFDASHYLPEYKGKCENVHGHTYKFEVVLKGKPERNGMVMDFLDVKKVVESKVLSMLDHKNLNDIFKLPTAENVVIWIFENLKKEMPNLSSVKLWEGRNSWVEYDGTED